MDTELLLGIITAMDKMCEEPYDMYEAGYSDAVEEYKHRLMAVLKEEE